ncbi:nitrite reductase large subunit NirB [Pseudokineococcus lusitanus]|uniref:assimilatory sulfite reductase (ferredoxin) n=1 Tax=Pseudokineococcus lusitanus TaxID=763993 RepID=A0A3N1HLK6_9ACTN|nr:nitrite reductase large subunit NirB [Pseudokineococcus lusitanus]ROP43351.1 nitrite reductase (NADH) large subunit [Pseudokineococcus lusitanus]
MTTAPSTTEVPAPRRGGTSGRRRLVVVGNGMAGARTLEELLARGGGEMFDITVFGDEPYGSYNRILLSGVLAGDDDEEGIVLNPREWYADNGIDLRCGVRVTGVRTAAREVVDATGAVTPYDVLVLATGSSSRVPPMEGVRRADGSLLPGVTGFRGLDDTRGLLDAARAHERAVVLGGGLLGLEAAHGLRRQGLDVTVLHSPAHLMNQQLDAAAGAVLRTSVEGTGVRVLTGTRASAVTGTDRVTGVVLPDGSHLAADVVVLTAGTTPNTGLAEAAGLDVDRAVVVDDRMRCGGAPSVAGASPTDGVYAVGECVQHRGVVYGLVAPLWEQATVLADVLTGADPTAEYRGSRTCTKLKVAGVDVAAMGLPAPELPGDELVVVAEPSRGVHLSAVVRDGVLVGATLLGDVSRTPALQQAFERGLPLPERRLELLLDLGGGAGEGDVADLDDDAPVCSCNQVTKGAITGAVAGGCTSVKGVMDATRAGKGCGTCKGVVGRLVELAADGALTEDPSVHWYVPGVPLRKDELVREIRERRLLSVSAVFAALAPGGEPDAKSSMGLTSLLRTLWPEDFEDERGGRFVNDRVHANIQRDGTFSVVPQMKGGVTTADELRRIADVADKYDVGMIKVTGGQRIDLLGVRKEDLPKVWEDLGMPSGYAYGKSMRTVKTCVGSDFCRFGLDDSTQLGIDLETRFQGLETPAKLKMAVVGCPRNCAEAYVKDVGVVAVGKGRWEVYVGGAAGASVRKGDLLATVGSAEEVITVVGRFVQLYREWGNWLERTYDFVPRMGLDRLQKVLLEDAGGLVAGLDADLEQAVAAYRDPWQEGREPVTPGQFRTALPLVPLPLVPRRAAGAPGGTSVADIGSDLAAAAAGPAGGAA